MRENNPFKLSRRLTVTALAVREGCRAADVGCDHGKLAAWMILTGRCEFVYASDISEPSLKKAADLFSRLKIRHKTQTILADGLTGLKPEDADDIVIAGLGFDTIKGIITDTDWLKNPGKHIILVPSSKHPQIRRFLYEEGFEILTESAVFEAGHAYTIIKAGYCGVKKTLTPEFAWTGKIMESPGNKSEYLRTVRQRNEKLLACTQGSGSSAAGKKRNDAAKILAYLDQAERKQPEIF